MPVPDLPERVGELVGAAEHTLDSVQRAVQRDLAARTEQLAASKRLGPFVAATRRFFEVEGLDELAGGPLVVAPNHTSIADAILPAWLLGRKKMRPRYILKRELLVDPCLDIVGNRVPNHFVIRDGDDTARELDAMRAMVADMGRLDATVIYPEGTVATPARMARALERIAERDPERAARMSALSTLMPPRHAGMHALLEGTPTADVAFVGHSGLGVVAEIAKTPQRIPFDHPVRVHVRRVPRSEIPADRHEFAAWLDEQWLSLDRVVAAAAG